MKYLCFGIIKYADFLIGDRSWFSFFSHMDTIEAYSIINYLILSWLKKFYLLSNKKDIFEAFHE
jgi:hypothetical protein